MTKHQNHHLKRDKRRARSVLTSIEVMPSMTITSLPEIDAIIKLTKTVFVDD